MKKEELEKLKRDSKQDISFLQDLAKEEKDFEKLVVRFSNRLTAKYAPEFGGVLRLNYDKFKRTIEIITSQKGAEITLKEDEIGEIPNQIMLLRQRRKRSGEIEEWKKTRSIV